MTGTPCVCAAANKLRMAAARRANARRTAGPSGKSKSVIRSRASSAARPEPRARGCNPRRILPGYFFFLRVRLLLLERDGTLPPARRASERPMAMACLRLVTFLPDRPLRSVPALRSCIARLTLLCDFLPYRLAMLPPFAATGFAPGARRLRSEEHTSELQSRRDLVCRLLL